MYCTGIQEIQFGDIESDGGCSTAFAKLGDTRSGTLAFNASDDQVQDITVEEKDDPIMQTMSQKGTLELSWSMVDWDTTILIAVLGGTVVNGQWQAPDQSPDVYKSLKVVPRSGKPFIYPRVKVTAKMNYNSTDKMFLLDIKCKRLKPEKAGEPPFMWGE